MPPGPPGIDDDTIRARCASPEAVAYTLYVRHLVGGPELAGGQAEVLRTAAAREILPARFTRQTLSEHLSGRYRHGPPWSTAEMIIRCLPEHAPRERIRAEAAALHRAAARQAAHRTGPGRIGSDNVSPDSGTGPDTSVDRRPVRDPAALRTVRRPNAPGRHGTAQRWRTPNTPPVADARPDANQPRGQYGRGAGRGWPGRDVALDIADLRADCARLTVQVLLIREPGTHPDRAAELSAALEQRQRSPLGQLSQHIDPTAALAHRALAQYLCAYAELGRSTVTELAIRTGLTAAVVAEILTARRVPTEAELRDLGAVLGVDNAVVWQLAGHARGARRGMPGNHR
ncbi:hypothetical protein GCM10022225_02580 [Plantactinospora mayteni]|uniref:HTH cro/C1-type domain-containing protein n=1 Tax=Plantactinospora mayteni TaxID=566021 RepID=A0ABQ4EQ19_9ACTN|nr:helix-turn-helix transcriptional regulator [Plantactinospora mayteni]GIG96746.1 hypothetical protein Pma05_33190 [Plantactinospora mayteni]